MPTTPLSAIFAAIDAANAQDPRTTTVAGEDRPYELVYGERMTAMLAHFAPAAPEALQIAARGQHIERWSIPRSDYPADRVGYLTWRNDLKELHARRLGEIIDDLAQPTELKERVQFLVRKKKLKSDPDTQTLEDVICLVFLRYYAAEFAADHEAEKVVDILSKTLKKMSERGINAALGLPLEPAVRDLVNKAADGEA